MEELILKLNGEEALLFCSRIKNNDVDFHSGEMIAPRLLLKIFSVFNELVTEKGFSLKEMPIAVSEKEVWLMRSYISPSDRITANNPVLGIILMRKLHTLLLEANCEVKMEQLENDFMEWAKQQPVKEEEKDATRDPCPDQDPDNNAPERTQDQPDEEIGTRKDLPGPERKDSPKD